MREGGCVMERVFLKRTGWSREIVVKLKEGCICLLLSMLL